MIMNDKSYFALTSKTISINKMTKTIVTNEKEKHIFYKDMNKEILINELEFSLSLHTG